MTVVNTNVKALFAQNSLQVNNRTLTNAMQQLSTGSRINSAKDDAAGLAIGTRMSADLRGMSVAIRNANDGISMMQTAEGALGEISNMLQRMRDLSTQSATGSLTTSNRQALQAEVDQLISEIDNVAKTTNFNGIKLLDGSAKGVSIQTGVKEGDQVSVNIESAESKDLGLQGFRVEGQLTSGRVGAMTALAAGNVQINGKDAFSSGTTPGANTALALAAAINTNGGQHRVTADAFNTYKGAAPTAGVFASGAVTVNGDTVGAASSIEELVGNINRDVAGVTARLASDGTIELSNDTGADIVIAGSAEETAGLTAGTYTGYVTLTSMDGSDISIKAKNIQNGYAADTGTLADVKLMGLNETGDVAGTSVGASVNSSKILQTDDLRINGVRVGTSVDASAAAKAAAINAVSSQSGVTATAFTQTAVEVDMTGTLMTGMTAASAATTFSINDVSIGTLANIDNLEDLVTAINAAGVQGIVASSDDLGRIILTSATGVDISVKDGSGTFVTSVDTLDGVNIGTAATTALTTRGRITLSSDIGADIRVESVSASASALIGFADQGGSSTVVGGALSIETQEGAGRAITVIDGALDALSMSRATLGAFQNRLTAAVDNLSSQSTNLAEAKGRIMDTDYAKATTELARAQIVQQAATAMLAQANQQPQMVLSLLQ